MTIRIPRTASCESCTDITVIHPYEGDTPEWTCSSCENGSGSFPTEPILRQCGEDEIVPEALKERMGLHHRDASTDTTAAAWEEMV